VPLGSWAAGLQAAGGGRAEQVVAQALPGGEQVVQADRQPLPRAALERRGGVGRSQTPLPGILAATGLLGIGRRWRRRGARTSQRRRRGVTPACASRAPPRLRTA
jgi:hypothetical protein